MFPFHVSGWADLPDHMAVLRVPRLVLELLSENIGTPTTCIRTAVCVLVRWETTYRNSYKTLLL